MYKRAKETAEKKRISNLKALFRKVVRIISLNNPWIKYEFDERATRNTKKNLSIRVRSKHRTGFLTVAEKTVIRTPQESRTIAERRKLCTLFATLPCFAHLSPKLRARLVPVARLLPLNQGRCIISKTDVPITVYYIVVGEVQMLKSDIHGNEVVEGLFGPGDVIGDVELLEGCDRTHTFKAATYCELLVLFDYDFAEILGPFMTKAWDEKKRALKALDYFDFFDDKQIVEACRLSTLRQYSPLDTMYCDDVGPLTNVHFILSGECLILQCLKMTVSTKKGKQFFKLMSAEDDDTSKMLRQGVKSEFSNQSRRNLKTASEAEISRLVATTSSTSDKDPNSVMNMARRMNLLDIEKTCGFSKENDPPLVSQLSGSSMKTKYWDKDFNGEEDYSEDFWRNWKDDDEDDDKDNGKDDAVVNDKTQDDKFHIEVTAPFSTSHLDITKSEESGLFLNLTSSSTSSEKGPFIDSRFIDVGSISFGGVFGLGEEMKHRVIMARTLVQCLTLPRFFLLENKQNPGNIWERRRFYLECMIPSREALFKQFLKTRKWKKFKNNFIRQNLPLRNQSTHIEDIPIICRIVESDGDQINDLK